jgi:PLP dependent protein
MAAGLTAVREAVMVAADRCGRDPSEILIVGISKEATPEAVADAYAAGLRDFGENRADELIVRAAALGPGARLHFVGRLQGNKVRKVRPVVALLHSLDRPELCGEWLKGPGIPPPVLVQVNVAGEPQKGGVTPSDAEGLVSYALSLGVEVQGLMTIPPLASDPEASRSHFAAMRRLRDEIRERHPSISDLSMGMSNDYAVAVEEGATILRVGRAIFGASHDEG